MKKITDLKVKKFRTIHKKDSNGNRVAEKEYYTGKKEVITVKSAQRFGHFFIDLICFQLIITLFDYLMNMIQLQVGYDTSISLTIGLILSFSSLLLYPIMYFVCEYYWQITPGKLITKTIVIDEYGNKPSLGALIRRSLIRIIPFEPFSCLDNYSRGWHDKWSDTFVVKKEELEKLKKLQKEQELKEANIT